MQKPLYLFFDTETTGVPQNYKAPLSDFDNWPRMIQIAWIICDAEQKQIDRKEFIIYPDGFEIPKEASDVHRITTEKAREEGVELMGVLQEFVTDLDKVNYLIGHNISFDMNIVASEMLRNQLGNKLRNRQFVCTMHSSTDFCAIPGRYGYKWPKLEELHLELFGDKFEDAHDALVDVEATIRCFWALKERGVLDI